MIEEENCCVLCGAVIPEGTQVCPICAAKLRREPIPADDRAAGKKIAVLHRQSEARHE